MSGTNEFPLTKVISGGQTGVDLAALRAAYQLGIETGGTVPTDYLKKVDQREAAIRYKLVVIQNCPRFKLSLIRRTICNIKDSDGTLAIRVKASPGTDCAINYCKTGAWNKRWGEHVTPPFRPVIVIDTFTPRTIGLVRRFIVDRNIHTLNVCGSRGFPTLQVFGDMTLEAFLRCVFRSIETDGVEDNGVEE